MKKILGWAVLAGLLITVTGCGKREEILIEFKYTPGSNGSPESCSPVIITNGTQFNIEGIIIHFLDDNAGLTISNIESGERAERHLHASKAGLTCDDVKELSQEDFEIELCNLKGEIESECKKLVRIIN